MSKYFKGGLGYALNIQLFGADEGSGGTPPADQETKTETPPAGDEPKTLDDILKDPKIQSDFDKRVQKSIETARSNWDKNIENIVNGKLTEAEKLNGMTEAQKKAYEKSQEDKALADREKAITVRELTATAKETLVDKGLPVSFASLLNLESAETVNASIEALSTEWQKAVQAGVADAIKSNALPNGSNGGANTANLDRFREMAGLPPKK